MKKRQRAVALYFIDKVSVASPWPPGAPSLMRFRLSLPDPPHPVGFFWCLLVVLARVVPHEASGSDQRMVTPTIC